MTYTITICGNVQAAGTDSAALERLTWLKFKDEEAATKAVNDLAANWHSPAAIWDIVALDYTPDMTDHTQPVTL